MFIKRLSDSIGITAAPEAQPETPAQTQPATNLGIAGGSDLFETAAPISFDFVQLQPENLSEVQASSSSNEMVSPEAIFRDLTVNPPQPDQRLVELYQRLDHLKAKKADLLQQLENVRGERMKAQEARAAVEDSLKNDKPLPEHIAGVLEGLGVLGVIGGALGLLHPVSVLFGGLFGGLSAAYRGKLHQARNELDRKMAENDKSAEEYKSETDEVNREQDKVMELIEKERRRLEQKFTEQVMPESLITLDGPWKEFRSPASVTSEDPSAVPFHLNIRKLTGEE